ncbi:hypothetical protein EDB89DRAFT_2076968 [Lactarius sanguifluus]|nr:hypothetical protein EDB89DRAFT_2076968 [Lactarius sanguifluus]
MSAESALTHAEVDYREGYIDSKIRQHLAAPSEEHSDEWFARFLMGIDLSNVPKTPAGSHCSHRSEILRPTVADAPLDARAVSADTDCLRRGATRRSARNAHALHVADAFLDDILTATVRARLTHLALPHFVGVPPAGAPRLAVLDSTPGLAAALAPSRPLHSAALRVANTAYDGFRPTTLFCALCGALKVLALVLAPDVDVAYIRAGVRRARKYRCGARASRAVSSDEVSLQALYKLGLLLSNVQALPTLRLQATLAIEVAKAEESPSRLVLWR